MSGAGYGNHDPANDADAKPDAAGQKPAAGGELSVAEKRSGSEAGAEPPAREQDDAATPGAGALSDGAQGDEVDPGAG